MVTERLGISHLHSTNISRHPRAQKTSTEHRVQLIPVNTEAERMHTNDSFIWKLPLSLLREAHVAKDRRCAVEFRCLGVHDI